MYYTLFHTILERSEPVLPLNRGQVNLSEDTERQPLLPPREGPPVAQPLSLWFPGVGAFVLEFLTL